MSVNSDQKSLKWTSIRLLSVSFSVKEDKLTARKNRIITLRLDIKAAVHGIARWYTAAAVIKYHCVKT